MALVLHKKVKPQKLIAKEVFCSQVAVSNVEMDAKQGENLKRLWKAKPIQELVEMAWIAAGTSALRDTI